MIEIHMTFTNGAEARQELTEFAELIMNGAAPNFMQIDNNGITIEKQRTTKPLPDTIDCGAASTSPFKEVHYGGNGAAQASEPLPQKAAPAQTPPVMQPAATANEPVTVPMQQPQPSPAPQQTPVAPPPPPTISRADFNVAITKWVSDQTNPTNFTKFRDLLKKYQVDALPHLKDEDLAAFAADARALGATI